MKLNLKKSSTIAAGVDPQNRKIISVVSVLSFTVDSSGICIPCPDVSVLVTDYDYYTNISYQGRIKPSILKRDIDGYVWKNATDLVIQGTARSESTVKFMNVDLECKGSKIDFFRRILVYGDRWVEKSITGFGFSDPEPFTEMPMRYDKAYGGNDDIAEAKNSDPEEIAALEYLLGEEAKEAGDFSYPRNPAGKGYIVENSCLNGLQLPNLEFPVFKLTIDKLVLPQKQWGRRPYPACFDWFPHMWFPRAAFFMETIDMEERGIPEIEEKLGIVPKGFLEQPQLKRPVHDFAQGAHPFLCRDRLKGDETIRITHMSRSGRPFHVILPSASPVMEIALYGKLLDPIDVMLDTVFIETDENRITLVWRASFPLTHTVLMPTWEKECIWDVNIELK